MMNPNRAALIRLTISPPLIAAMRMVLAAVLAFAASRLSGLPEGYWAVMSAVIVTRPDIADAVQAGIMRASGTLAGCAAGVATVFAQRYGAPEALALITMLAVIALMAAYDARFRAAPMAAVIVASAGQHGAEPITVATFRLLEIALGIAAGLLTQRFVLRRASLRIDRHQLAGFFDALAADLRPAGQSAAQGETVRATLRRLVLTAGAAEKDSEAARWLALAGACQSDARFYARGARDAVMPEALADAAQTLAVSFESLAARFRSNDAPPPLEAPELAGLRNAATQVETAADRLRVQALQFTLHRLRRQYEAASRLANPETFPREGKNSTET